MIHHHKHAPLLMSRFLDVCILAEAGHPPPSPTAGGDTQNVARGGPAAALGTLNPQQPTARSWLSHLCDCRLLAMRRCGYSPTLAPAQPPKQHSSSRCGRHKVLQHLLQAWPGLTACARAHARQPDMPLIPVIRRSAFVPGLSHGCMHSTASSAPCSWPAARTQLCLLVRTDLKPVSTTPPQDPFPINLGSPNQAPSHSGCRCSRWP